THASRADAARFPLTLETAHEMDTQRLWRRASHQRHGQTSGVARIGRAGGGGRRRAADLARARDDSPARRKALRPAPCKKDSTMSDLVWTPKLVEERLAEAAA